MFFNWRYNEKSLTPNPNGKNEIAPNAWELRKYLMFRIETSNPTVEYATKNWIDIAINEIVDKVEIFAQITGFLFFVCVIRIVINIISGINRIRKLL
ncbi:MAG TPA: hypothetical protein EYO26_05195 [Dehalococcoidia bacterium]|nr:hypothetical protein [Dehalococcoidia bacterium]